MKYLFIFITLCSFLFAQTNYKEIEDKNELKYLTPSLANRKIAKLQLNNGLHALIISDENADQSSASITIRAGSWQDPEDYPGMAHFLEHMLFKGTKKYPEEEGFMQYIWDHGGAVNAYTADDRTSYMFSINNDAFKEGLDRLSHFFIDPLFDYSGLQRELIAVDQEYKKNVENDAWRAHQIFKEMNNPTHPNHKFSTGNSQTLGHIPREAMINWYQSHYSAEHMYLVIYSPKPISDLKNYVTDFFQDIPNRNIPYLHIDQPIMSSNQTSHITYIKPVKQIQNLSLLWELPKEFADDDSKSSDLVAYILQSGQKNTLFSYLKDKQYIEDLSVESETIGNHHALFEISLDLTDIGLANVSTIINHCFEAIANLKNEGISSSYFDEMNAISKLHYQYQDRIDAFNFVYDMSFKLLYEKLRTFPQNTYLAKEYDDQKIKSLLSHLSAKNCHFSLITPLEKINITPEKKECWLGGEYSIKPIPEELLNLWDRSQPNPQIQLPSLNPYIPENLQLLSSQENSSLSYPNVIVDNEKAKIYYAKDDLYQMPKVSHFFKIKSPLFDGSDYSYVCMEIFSKHLYELSTPILISAEMVKLYAQINVSAYSLDLSVSGYNDKSNLFIKELLQLYKNSTPPSKDEFNIYKESLLKEYQNMSKNLAVSQADELTSHILSHDMSLSKEKNKTLSSLSYDKYLEFHKHALDKVFIKGFFSGNIDKTQALELWENFNYLFSNQAFIEKLHFSKHVLNLMDKEGPYIIEEEAQTKGTGIILVIDQGPFTYKDKAAQQILSQVLKEAFFTALRTKQKTAYIAQSGDKEIEKHLFQIFAVQSSSHLSQDLLYRFELFLEEFTRELPSYVSQDRFNDIRTSLIDILQKGPKNLNEMSMRLKQIICDYDEDFERVNKRIQAFQEISYEEFVSFCEKTLSQSNTKRLAIVKQGDLSPTIPFKYKAISSKQLINEKDRSEK